MQLSNDQTAALLAFGAIPQHYGGTVVACQCSAHPGVHPLGAECVPVVVKADWQDGPQTMHGSIWYGEEWPFPRVPECAAWL